MTKQKKYFRKNTIRLDILVDSAKHTWNELALELIETLENSKLNIKN